MKSNFPSFLSHASGFMSKTAARWLGCAAIALLLIAGGRQDAEASLVIDMWVDGGSVHARYTGSLAGTFTTTITTAVGPSSTANQVLGGSGGAGLRHLRSQPSISATRGDAFLETAPVPDYLVSPFAVMPTGPNITLGANTTYVEILLRQSTNRFDASIRPLGVNGSAAGDNWSAAFDGIGFDTGLPPLTFTAFDGSSRLWDFAGTGADVTLNLLSAPPSAIPEPTTALGLMGLVTSAFFRRRRRLLA